MSNGPYWEQFGKDEWAAREEARLREAEAAGRLSFRLRRAWKGVDPRLKLLAALAVASTLPLFVHNPYLMRVAGLTGLYIMLSLGLNVVAGFAGLLDLGYVAFYGLGAYAYALLASPQFDQHWPFWLVLPLVILLTALFGFLLGSPSLRLRGDYLAIVTLGFGQIANLLFLNLGRISPPFLHLEKPLNITGGPNGIINIDDIRILGYSVETVSGYYYLILVFAALVFLAIFHLDHSRIGRAWRAIREDELAAQTMGVDVRWLKLLAFSVGAAIAGTAGVLFAAWQGAVFPPNFDVTILIILYSMVVLGGVGSIWGAVSGALILSVLPELLRSPETARLIFYGALILAVMWLSRRTKLRSLALLGGVGVLGVGLKVVLTGLRPEWFLQPELKISVAQSVFGPLMRALNWWMLFPRQSRAVGNVAFVLVLFLLLAVLRFKGTARSLLLVPSLYALVFVWETRLVQEPSVTRMLIFGALLVLMMNYRPHGLFGERRVQKL
ncbi:MAG: branched-chain amino acid ABC transporter permease [Anaerolineales bacterium]|nr:branched-chain amino acid ABC transporter permease [Anaerolineales bacterium]